jgi:hypothetical protein
MLGKQSIGFSDRPCGRFEPYCLLSTQGRRSGALAPWSEQPAFTVENRLYRWQQLVEDFCLYDVNCCP